MAFSGKAVLFFDVDQPEKMQKSVKGSHGAATNKGVPCFIVDPVLSNCTGVQIGKSPEVFFCIESPLPSASYHRIRPGDAPSAGSDSISEWRCNLHRPGYSALADCPGQRDHGADVAFRWENIPRTPVLAGCFACPYIAWHIAAVRFPLSCPLCFLYHDCLRCY